MKQEKIVLVNNKLPHDQMKFIIFEESLVKCCERCFKCDSVCAVCLESTVGTFCRMSVTCSVVILITGLLGRQGHCTIGYLCLV